MPERGAVEQLVLSASLDRVRIPAEGLHGGNPGRRSRFAVRGANGELTEIPSGYTVLNADDAALVLEVAGGGFGSRVLGTFARNLCLATAVDRLAHAREVKVVATERVQMLVHQRSRQRERCVVDRVALGA